jgi:hypothetical protein
VSVSTNVVDDMSRDDVSRQAPPITEESAQRIVDRRVVLQAIPIAITPLIDANARAPRPAPPADLRPIAAHRHMTYATDEPMSSIAVGVQGITAVNLYPRSSMERADNTPLENLSFTGLYHLSENHSIGGVIGRENHAIAFADLSSSDGSGSPIINKDETNPDFEAVPDLTNNGSGTGSLGSSPVRNARPDSNATDGILTDRLQTTTEWVGVSYQFRAGALDRRGTIRPFAQAVVGGTFAGDPLGKATVGLLWKPSRRVSIGAGIEGSALVFRQEGEWQSSRKIGATYGVQIEF